MKRYFLLTFIGLSGCGTSGQVDSLPRRLTESNMDFVTCISRGPISGGVYYTRYSQPDGVLLRSFNYTTRQDSLVREFFGSQVLAITASDKPGYLTILARDNSSQHVLMTLSPSGGSLVSDSISSECFPVGIIGVTLAGKGSSACVVSWSDQSIAVCSGHCECYTIRDSGQVLAVSSDDSTIFWLAKEQDRSGLYTLKSLNLDTRRTLELWEGQMDFIASSDEWEVHIAIGRSKAWFGWYNPASGSSMLVELSRPTPRVDDPLFESLRTVEVPGMIGPMAVGGSDHVVLGGCHSSTVPQEMEIGPNTFIRVALACGLAEFP